MTTATTVTGKITGVREGGTSPSQYGELHRFYLDIQGEDGERIEGGAIRQKPTSPVPQSGDSITVEVTQGQHGPMLKRVQVDENGQRKQFSNSNGSKRDSREEGQIIGWAHTLAAFELAHDLSHEDVAVRAKQILSARTATAEPPATSPDATPQAQPPVNGADSAGQSSIVAETDDDDGVPF